MNVLVTGAFGNIGESTIQELVKQGHRVRCFDVKTKGNERTAKKYKGEVEVVWGDVRRLSDVTSAVRDQDAVIHLAFIIASNTSVTGKSCNDDPQWAREINIVGTQNVVEASKAQSKHPRILFASSIVVFGVTQDQPPPRKASDPVYATDAYSAHKIECEELFKASGLPWVILRLGVGFPLRPVVSGDMFNSPLNNRIEYVYTRDVGLAFAKAVSSDGAVGKILLIGGGPGCQLYYGAIMEKLLVTMGVGMLPAKAFGTKPYYMDWLDTTESQNILKFQRHTFDDYVEEMKSILGYKRHLARLFRPFVRRYLLGKSPYYKRKQEVTPHSHEDSLPVQHTAE